MDVPVKSIPASSVSFTRAALTRAPMTSVAEPRRLGKHSAVRLPLPLPRLRRARPVLP